MKQLLAGLLMSAVMVQNFLAVTYGMEGILRDPHGNPVPGAWIEIRQVEHGILSAADFVGPPIEAQRTDGNGYWSMRGLPSGTWILTAVATEAPRTDDEMRELVQPRAKAGLPDGVALSRIIRTFGPEPGTIRLGSQTEVIDIGVALEASTQEPFRGRLVGDFSPATTGYEVRVSPVFKMKREPQGDGTMRVTNDGPQPVYSVVPDERGSFDFGRLAVEKYDSFQVDAFPLGSANPWLRTTVFQGQLLRMKAGDDGYDIPVERPYPVTLRTSGARPDDGDRVQYTVWSDEGREQSWYVEPHRSSIQRSLPAGSFTARASAGTLASPLIAFHVGEDAGDDEVTLPLLHCVPFSVRFEDPQGSPLASAAVHVGTDDTSEFKYPYPITAFCSDGRVEFEHLLPGDYNMSIKVSGMTIERKVVLGPEAPVIVIP